MLTKNNRSLSGESQ